MRVVGWSRGYQRGWLRSDVIAGTSAAAVVVPQAMGYATVAGLPVQVGVYTCIVPMVVYALLGGSRRLSFSTTSTIVALTALALAASGADSASTAVGATATLALLVGVTLFVFWALRLGWVVEAVSEATITGLKFGVGLTIMADQLPKLLGIEPADDGFFRDIADAIASLSDASAVTAALGFGTIVGLLAIKRWARQVPGPLVALVVSIGLVAVFGLDDHGVELTPDVPTGFPLPDVPPMNSVTTLLPYAVAIAVMSYFESVTAARLARQPDDPPLNNNHEFVAVGTATLAGAFFQAVPPAGGFSQTQVNVGAGARTQLSELVTAAWAVAVALFLAPILSDLPTATLGAIVVAAVAGLVSVPDLARIARISPFELVVALVTAAFALAVNLLAGVVAGVVLTFYLVLRTLNHPVIVELRPSPLTGELVPARAGDQAVPGMLILRVEGGLYTLNIRRVQAELYDRASAAQTRPQVVLLDAGGIADTSVTVLDALAEIHQQLARQGSSLWVAALPTRALAKAQRTRAWDAWADAGRVHRTVAEAVHTYVRDHD